MRRAGTGGEVARRGVPRAAAVGVAAETVDGATTDQSATGPGRGMSVLVVLAIVVIPLAVALGVLSRSSWYPTLDLAQTEIRVRDVWSSHPPLIGLAGRIGAFGQGGSHPGPLSFWALWPLYRLFGSGSWALEAAAVALNVVAIGTSLWIAHRRGGTPLVLAVGAVLALLMRAYGATLLTEPWNPYLPILWWFLLLLAVWSVLCDDPVALPVVVFAGSFCMQTHVSYLGLASGLVAISAAAFAYRAWTLRKERPERTRWVRWGLVSLVVVTLLWTPPAIDQIVHSPGNLSILWQHFRDPPEPAIGAREGLRALLANLNPWRLVERLHFVAGKTRSSSGSLVPGVLFVITWFAAWVVAWRAHLRRLVRLHLVVAITLVLGVASASRINGFVWFYLLLWGWGLAALMLLAVGWTAVAVARPHLHRAIGELANLGLVALAVVIVAVTASFTSSAASVDVPAPHLSATVGELSGPTADALRARRVDSPFLVTWLPDPLTIGAEGFGLLNELLREGFDARADQNQHGGATPYRVMDPDDARLEVHLAIGPEIERWRAKPGFPEVTSFDPRTRRQRTEFEGLRLEVIAGLERAGHPELVPTVDDNMFVLTFDDRVPEGIKRKVDRMQELGLPGAVFLGTLAPQT
jgi:hypothetical protein